MNVSQVFPVRIISHSDMERVLIMLLGPQPPLRGALSTISSASVFLLLMSFIVAADQANVLLSESR